MARDKFLDRLGYMVSHMKALAEFMALYKTEFNETISKDEAAIMARNLVIFYKELYDKGVFKPRSRRSESNHHLPDKFLGHDRSYAFRARKLPQSQPPIALAPPLHIL